MKTKITTCGSENTDPGVTIVTAKIKIKKLSQTHLRNSKKPGLPPPKATTGLQNRCFKNGACKKEVY
jgi:hypothetical protein